MHIKIGDIMQKDKQFYEELIKEKYDFIVMTKNFLLAFLFGGVICIIGQAFYDIFFYAFKMDATSSGIYMYLCVIFIAGILTAFGIYDRLGQIGKCGLAIPITGFANAAVCSAMEYHKEGIILGIGANCLKLAGSVLVLGTVSAIIVSSIRYIFEVLI